MCVKLDFLENPCPPPPHSCGGNQTLNWSRRSEGTRYQSRSWWTPGAAADSEQKKKKKKNEMSAMSHLGLRGSHCRGWGGSRCSSSHANLHRRWDEFSLYNI